MILDLTYCEEMNVCRVRNTENGREKIASLPDFDAPVLRDWLAMAKANPGVPVEFNLVRPENRMPGEVPQSPRLGKVVKNEL